MILRRLKNTDEKAFLKAIVEWEESPGFEFFRGYTKEMQYPEYMELLEAQERGERLPEGYVPDTSLFGFLEDGTIVGRLSLRHRLSDFLIKIGGHIGYGVMPNHRRKGYATKMLAQSLEFARELKLEKVLLTCDDTNLGSIKTIEVCGGKLENIVEQKEGLPPKHRYWITLS